MTDITTPRPRLPDHVIEPRDAFVRQRARQAADAAQHVIDLEAALDAAMRENSDLHSKLNVSDESNKILHEQIALLTDKCERLQTRNTVIMERLRSSASLIVDLVKDPDEPYAPNPSAARLAAVANEQPTRIEPMTAEEQEEIRRLGSIFRPRANPFETDQR